MTTIAEAGKVAAGRRERPRVFLRADVDAAGRGVLVPADPSQASLLRARKLKRGKVYAATIVAVRNPGFHRKLHSLMIALAGNVERLASYAPGNAHGLLKRIQLEARVQCDEIMIEGGFICYIPRSFSFDRMEEAEFAAAYNEILDYIRRVYLPGMTDAQVEEMIAFASDDA